MMKLESLQRVNGKAQSASRADLPVVVTRQRYGLFLLLDKVHRTGLGKGSKARAKTGRESSTSAICPNKVHTSSSTRFGRASTRVSSPALMATRCWRRPCAKVGYSAGATG